MVISCNPYICDNCISVLNTGTGNFYAEVLKRGGFAPSDFEIEVVIMNNELALVPWGRPTKQDRLLPGHEYEELRGL